MIDRRNFNVGLLASGAGAAINGGAKSRALADNENLGGITRIAFGSCSRPELPQTIWKTIAGTKPDIFISLGDIVYADKADVTKNGLEIALDNAFRKMAENEDFNQFRARIPVEATWDDNDFGPKDGGGDYANKEHSRQRFLDFWNLPKNDRRYNQSDGIYACKELGSSDRRVQLILLDTRFKRSHLKRRSEQEILSLGPSNFGPYLPSEDPDAQLLGKEQWAWLEKQLRKPASVRVICSSIPFVASYRGWENWSNFPSEKQRMVDLISSTNAQGILFISGDSHYGEISLDEKIGPYPLWDVTSSGLTHHWPVPGPNRYRVHGQSVHSENFGLLHIVWQEKGTLLVLEVRKASGDIALQQVIGLEPPRKKIHFQSTGENH